MNAWLIVPRDPLIFRDGKPFTGTPGERARSLGFPFPSTIAGAVRTRSGTDPKTGFDAGRIAELLEKTIRGPFLVELNHDGNIGRRFLPAPADALIVEDEKGVIRRYALAPIEPPEDGHTDLGGSLVGHIPHIKDKPYKKAPHYWEWGELKKWLVEAGDDSPDLSAFVLEDLVRDRRVHVSIKKESQTSEEGALFQTSGMEFTRAVLNPEKRTSDAFPLALALETDAALTAGVDTLGGERRIVNWTETEEAFPETACPDEIKNRIVSLKRCRLVLATPAYFQNGYLPEYLRSTFKVGVEAVAAARYQTISGWDYAAKDKDGNPIRGGAPKRTRRLVPAGSVYFLNLEEADADAFVDAVWLQAVSDDGQARRDGFGIALLGTWDGTVKSMEVKR